MKHFYTLMVALFIATTAVMAQPKIEQSLWKTAKTTAQKNKVMTPRWAAQKHNGARMAAQRNRLRVEATPEGKRNLPQKEEDYSYNNGEKYLNGTALYTYDEYGNIIVQYILAENWVQKTTNRYDELGRIVESIADEGKDSTYYTTHNMEQYEYDKVVASQMVKKYLTVVNDTDATQNGGDSTVITVERNSDGNITKVENRRWCSYEWLTSDEVTQLIITYGADKKPTELHTTVVDKNADDKVTKEVFFKDIEWKDCNGQIFKALNDHDFLEGDNRMTKATLINKTEYDTDTTIIDVGYDDNGGYTQKLFQPTSSVPSSSRTLENIDNNGSVKTTTVFYEDLDSTGTITPGDSTSIIITQYTYDDKGFPSKAESWDIVPGAQKSYNFHRFENTYSEVDDYPSKITDTRDGLDLLTETYDDIEEEFYAETVYSDFIQVSATSISSPVATPNAANGVYNLNGVKVGSDTGNLPKGIYIVKKGTETKKVVVQ